jgi:hypothetical protein
VTRIRRVCGARSPSSLAPRLADVFTDLLKAKRAARRLPLAEIDPNAPRETRSGPIRPLADASAPPRPRKRVRRTHDELDAARSQPIGPAPPPSPPPPTVLPIGYRSRYQDWPAHDLGAMDTICEKCMARHWVSEAIAGAGQRFELCCKQGDVVLDELRAPPSFLRALLEGDDPRARSFR